MIRRDNCLLEPRRSKTHLPSPVRQSKEGHGGFDPSLRAELIQNIDRRLRELKFSDSICPVRKSMPSKPVVLELPNDDVLRRRGSVYQSSKEIRKMRSLHDQRRKFKSSQGGGEDFLSFEILNSSTLCTHVEGKKTAQSSNLSLNASSSDLPSASTDAIGRTRGNPAEILDLSSHLLPDEKPSTSGSDDYVRKDDKLDNLLEISLTGNDRLSYSRAASELIVGGVDDNKASKCDEVQPLENDANALPERDKLQALPKSFSAKTELLSSLRPVDETVHRGDTKSRYSAFRRILDPIGKSKSQRNSSFLQPATGCTRTDDPNNIQGNNETVTSVSDNLSSTIRDTKNVEPVMLGKQGIPVASPVHLKCILKQENRQGIPYYEFFAKDSDDVLTARKWKTDSTLDWVYTFYSNKRKTNSTARGMKDRSRCELIGQMQASCHMCSEVGRNGSVDNSSVSEFVLYDIAQARRSMAADERAQMPGQTINHPRAPDVDVTKIPGNNPSSCEKGNLPSRHGQDSEGDTSHLLPWATSKLLPHLEVAAIVVDIPFETKVKLKDTKKNETCAKTNTGLSTLCVSDQCKGAVLNSLDSANVKAITPSARHGLPSEEGCPSPLLHRWRSGGGCDCGGWDMGCSITVLENNAANDSGDNCSENLHRTLFLSVQGSKDSIPTFALRSHTEGYHSICFHAQLSSLQAFSIGVAMLHCLTSSALDALEKGTPIFHSNSLKLLLEEEVKQLLNAVAEEEKRKTKMVIEPMPPFSPIGRV